MIWEEFKGTKWKKEIDVEDFIINNYTPYDGDETFLCGPTARTKKLFEKVEKLLAREHQKGGVLNVDTSVATGINAYNPGYIDKTLDIIVGLQTDAPLKRGINPFGGLRTCEQSCHEYGYHLPNLIKEQFKYRTTHNSGVFRAYTDEMRKARHCGILTGLPDAYGRGRLIGDYRRVALYGMDYLIAQKKVDKNIFGKSTMTEESIHNIEDLYLQIDAMEDLKKMALSYGIDISKPAESAKDAIQWLYFGYLGSVKEQNGAANSIGRISAFIDIYIERDLKKGILAEEAVQELIDDFIIKLRLVRHLRTSDYNALFAGDPTWVTLSETGLSSDGRHMVTKTAFRVLNTLYSLGPSSEPNITILWSDQLPLPYKQFCAKVSIDTDSIQYENDDMMRPIFGCDYAISCCVSAMKEGKQMQYFGARCNLPKLLLMALNGGKDEIKGEQIGPAGKVFEAGILDYNKVYKAYKEYSKWLSDLYVNTMNVIHYMHDKYAYESLTMGLHDTDVTRLMAFGISGLSVLADSFSAIKYAKVTAIKDERGIITDFSIDGDFPKFGNDDDRVDSIAQGITEDFYNNLIKTPCYRNAVHTLSILTITSNVVYGAHTGATPDGRKKGEPFAPGANPMHGRDKSGALASLNSVAKINYDYCRDGISNTFSVVPYTLGQTTQQQKNTLVELIDGYFKQKGHQLNVNVLNREMLIEAMNDPKKYPNLTVRVSGYAVNFNKLTKQQQEEVINRTFHEKI
ncbi:MAG: formate C-acetyltransferase [Christensenellaceae bacterium]|jgi:formate C-acetyltransferase|nr:formate C-acetyltransferase [Christensenellaceae bacterium]